MSKASDNEALVRKVQVYLGVEVDGWGGAATDKAWEAKHPSPAAKTHSLKDPAAFFGGIRPLTGALNQSQVDGFNTLLKIMAPWPVSWAAYGLATAWPETAFTMQPIHEYGGPAYFKRRYDIEGSKPALARDLGNIHPGDGVKYAGRGYVQITGRTNYRRFGIEDAPDDALKPDVAARIMVEGMTKGSFTGKKLADYLPGDYVNARRIINGTDNAEKIAGYARAFEAALRAGGWS